MVGADDAGDAGGSEHGGTGVGRTGTGNSGRMGGAAGVGGRVGSAAAAGAMAGWLLADAVGCVAGCAEGDGQLPAAELATGAAAQFAVVAGVGVERRVGSRMAVVSAVVSAVVFVAVARAGRRLARVAHTGAVSLGADGFVARAAAAVGRI